MESIQTISRDEDLTKQLEQCIKDEISLRDSSEGNPKLHLVLLKEYFLVLQLGNYHVARHLWRRLPHSYHSSPIFQHLWQITCAMFHQDSKWVFQLLKTMQKEIQNDHDNDALKQCQRLKDMYRSRVEQSLCQCYRNIHLEKAMTLLGYDAQEEAYMMEYLKSRGWTRKDDNDFYWIPRPPVITSKNDLNSKEEKLQALTDMVMFMERKRFIA